MCWAVGFEKKHRGLVAFAHRPHKSGARTVADPDGRLRWPLQATQGVAGYMRREETKCKKPLAGAKSSAIQFSLILSSFLKPAAVAPAAIYGSKLLAWDRAVGSPPVVRCSTNTSLTVHRPALALSMAGHRSSKTCDSLTVRRLGYRPPADR